MDIIQTRISYLDDINKITDILITSLKGIDNIRAKKHLERAKDGYLFFEVTDCDSISRMFRRTRMKLKLKGIRFHDLRHTFGTYYLNSGGRIEILREILGHKDIKTTEIYAKVLQKTILKGIDKFTDF